MIVAHWSGRDPVIPEMMGMSLLALAHLAMKCTIQVKASAYLFLVSIKVCIMVDKYIYISS